MLTAGSLAGRLEGLITWGMLLGLAGVMPLRPCNSLSAGVAGAGVEAAADASDLLVPACSEAASASGNLPEI